MLTADAVVDAVSAHLPTDGSCRLAVFDHITSNTALRLPIERIVALCRHRGVPVLIDGAHGLMSDALFLDTLGADYYCGNMHKWCCAPKGSAFLYVRDPTAPHHPPRHVAPPSDESRAESPRTSPRRSPQRSPRTSPQRSPQRSPRSRQRSQAQELPRAPLPRPAILSHGAAAGFLSSFIWDGHRDYSPALAVPVALRFWTAVGPQRAREYMRALARRATALLCERWATSPLTSDPALTGIPMALVRLPVRAADVRTRGRSPHAEVGPVQRPGAEAGARRLSFHLPIPDDEACTSAHAKAIQVRVSVRGRSLLVLNPLPSPLPAGRPALRVQDRSPGQMRVGRPLRPHLGACLQRAARLRGPRHRRPGHAQATADAQARIVAPARFIGLALPRQRAVCRARGAYALCATAHYVRVSPHADVGQARCPYSVSSNDSCQAPLRTKSCSGLRFHSPSVDGRGYRRGTHPCLGKG